MNMTPHRRLAFAVTALIIAINTSNGVEPTDEFAADSNSAEIPGGRVQDAALAIHDSHEFAWRLFLALNRQGKPGTAGKVDPNSRSIRDYDPDQPVVWETWALCSGGRAGAVYMPPNESEVFKDGGAKPVAWEQLPRQPEPRKVFEPFPGKGLSFLLAAGRAAGEFDVIEDGGEGGVEVRMNRATYDYIRQENLYSIEGLENKFREGAELVFPKQSKEIKARWVRISDEDKPRYHWRSVTTSNGEQQLWGLSALHIITADLPNWFWCDFEHVEFERHAEQYSQDATTRGENPPAGSQGIRRETVGTKWETMRLRGAQISFVDAQGHPTILANSQLEHGIQQKSSCMTCHARATVGLRTARPDILAWQANTLPLNLAKSPVIDEPVGAPKPEWYVNPYGNRQYLQTHFLWSLPFRALSTAQAPPD